MAACSFSYVLCCYGPCVDQLWQTGSGPVKGRHSLRCGPDVSASSGPELGQTNFAVGQCQTDVYFF